MRAVYFDAPEGSGAPVTAVLVEGLARARAAGVDVVPITGRNRVQARELCSLLGLPRAIAELGCVHVEGHEVRYEFGDFPFTGVTPIEAMEAEGAIECALSVGLEPDDPWNEGRDATYVLRGDVEAAVVNAALDEAGFRWCGVLQDGGHGATGIYHLAPTGTGRAFGMRLDMEAHGLTVADVVYVDASDWDAIAAGVDSFLSSPPSPSSPPSTSSP